MDTIFALATARGKAGIAVIRVSGPDAFAAAQALSGRAVSGRSMRLATLRGADGQPLDHALILAFDAGGSFTGEPVVELQCHGAPAVVSALLSELAGLPGLRLAEPGEFTRRALENNRLDLAQVEGLADLIDAETEAQRKQALRVFSGALGDKVGGWRRSLLRAAALLEAVIDFADEDVPEDVYPEVRALIDSVLPDLRAQVAGTTAAERIRDGFEVAILGAPNAGKSTLLNALAGREAAITSEIAGTTRDVIEVRMDLAGLPVTLLDTAGLRETEDHVEAIGVARARARAEAADLRVVLTSDGTLPDLVLEADDLVVTSKSDLGTSGPGLHISARTGTGITELIAAITTRLERRASGAGLAIRARHRSAMEEAVRLLDGLHLAEGREEIAADALRRAILRLDSVIGHVDVEHILDEIFASFCLGK